MTSILNNKNQATIPEDIRKHLGIGVGDSVGFQILTDGRITIAATTLSTNLPHSEDPYRQFLGIGISGLSTEEILQETRGE